MIPFTLLTLDHIVLRVADLSQSLAFYCEGLGASLEKVQDDIGLWQLRAGTSLIDLVPLAGMLGARGGKGPGQQDRNLDHFALEITPFDRDVIHAHLARHGIAIIEEGARHGARGVGPALYICDPDGNMVGLKARDRCCSCLHKLRASLGAHAAL